MPELRMLDNDHIIYGNRQFVSLEYYHNNRQKDLDEMKTLNKTIEEYCAENNAYKILLKDKLMKEEV